MHYMPAYCSYDTMVYHADEKCRHSFLPEKQISNSQIIKIKDYRITYENMYTDWKNIEIVRTCVFIFIAEPLGCLSKEGMI